jgi:anti-sigma factor RsiW
MSCSPFDLRDYFFGELPEADRRQADLHLKTCAGCREELETLQSTQAVLLSVPDEEIPQRIGFVSDRVYEPSAVRRWWGALWNNGPRLGFAAAAMLSVSILFSATHRPGVAAVPADVSRQVNEAVAKAVAESDARHLQQTAKLLDAATERFDERLKAERQLVSERYDIAQRYDAATYRATYYSGGSR